MSRRRIAAVAALAVVPVALAAIVLASLLESGNSNQTPGATQPAETPIQPEAKAPPGASAPPAPSSPGGQTGGAKPPSKPLSVLDNGAPPPKLDQKLAPARSNGALNLAELRGVPIVLNIWSSQCTPCRGEARVLESEWERLGQRGVLFVGLNVLDSPGGARRFRKDYAVTYPSLQESRSDTARALGARGVPETFFISKSGKIESHVIGAVSLAQVELGVRAAETGHPLPTDQGGGQIPLH